MIDALFVLRDLGETNALVPVIEELVAKGRDVQVLALGQAAQGRLAAGTRDRIQFVIPDEVDGVRTRLGTAATDFGGASALQAAFVDPSDPLRLAQHLESHVVVLGVVGRSQREFASAAKDLAAGRIERWRTLNPQGAALGKDINLFKQIGYYGSLPVNINCALLRAEPGQAGANESYPFVSTLDALWLPMQSFIGPIVSRIGIDRTRVTAVGQPDVDAFFALLPSLESEAQDVRGRLQMEPGESLVFFASGRDEPGSTLFRSAFLTFLEGVRDARAAGKKLKVMVGVHPACSGAQEQRLVEALQLGDSVRTIRTVTQPQGPVEWSTNQLMVAADRVLTWNSTAASLLALSPGGADKVMFVASEGPPEIFAAVQAGLALQATTRDEVAHFLRRTDHESPQGKRPIALMPRHAAATMASHLDAAIALAKRTESFFDETCAQND